MTSTPQTPHNPLTTEGARDWFLGLQERICDEVGREDGKTFIRDAWERPPGGRLEGRGITRLIEPVPEEGEISVTASNEIGATLREDWLSQAPSNGATMEWPSHAMDGLDDERRSPHPKPNPNFFPDPGTTEWSVSEMRFKNK